MQQVTVPVAHTASSALQAADPLKIEGQLGSCRTAAFTHSVIPMYRYLVTTGSSTKLPE